LTHILSLDFGGSKLAAGLVELEASPEHSPGHGKVLARHNLPTPQHRQASLEAMLHMGDSLLEELPGAISGVGASFGGLVALDGRTVKRSHHVPGWEGFPLATALEEKFGAPAWVLNDADAAALGEYHFGAGQGASSLLYLTVSTGIGGGLVLDGQLFRGAHALAGEIGHMVLLPEGPRVPVRQTGLPGSAGIRALDCAAHDSTAGRRHR
jgi:glucokinase